MAVPTIEAAARVGWAPNFTVDKRGCRWQRFCVEATQPTGSIVRLLDRRGVFVADCMVGETIEIMLDVLPAGGLILSVVPPVGEA